ncbi:secreted glycosyl hydrolase [Boeremia exigua]|uniref:secreted glycosyl hydrolase n=1 Tax=Boeremia exigua TaxID=749465 RepID=UPI001E8DCDB2|nr:secreted glycosyl hydrolase [Boeremia exigua]KAH6637688.1 secreted glycosyl hydrolase [Boeremia exigua]
MALKQPFNVLIFSKTAGYRHESISTGITAFRDLALQTGLFTITDSEDASLFEPSRLSHYSVIVLLHTSGTFLSASQLRAFQDFVRSGGGVLSIHGAASGMPSSSWYGKLIGAHFDMHPDAEQGSLIVSNKSHPIIDDERPPEKWMDEWYNFKSHPAANSSLQILLCGDTSSFKGGKHGDNHPLAWCQEFEGGKSVYIALGHFKEVWENTWYMGLVKRGIMWAARGALHVE